MSNQGLIYLALNVPFQIFMRNPARPQPGKNTVIMNMFVALVVM